MEVGGESHGQIRRSRDPVGQAGDGFRFPTETTEVLSSPGETGDRYRARVTAPPGGGPGITGSGPHAHPGLVEVFRCVSGTMTARLGRDVFTVPPGEVIEVAPGVVHGFVNAGEDDLVVAVDIVFTPPGPRPEADLVVFGHLVDRLVSEGRVSRRTGLPSMLQMAVLLHDRFPEAMTPPGLASHLMGPLARLGRLTGLSADLPEYDH